MTDRTARLSTTAPGGSSLRWELRGGASYRAYSSSRDPSSTFCVSTRSAEAVFVLEGEVVLDVGPRRQDVRIRPDQAVIVGRGTAHTCHTAPNSRFLVIDLIDLPAGALVALPPHRVGTALHELASELWREDRSASVERLRTGIEQLRQASASATPIAIEESHHSRRMHSVKSFLEANYRDALNIGKLATSWHLDQHYLMRRFKQNFGVPPLAYLQFLRIEHFVWETLRHAATDPVSNTRLALEAGFGDYPTFSRKLHAWFGKPPSRLVESGRAP